MNVAQPIEWTSKGVVMLDQRLLPGEVIRHTYTDYREVAAAIKDMVIRGAPAIGVAAAMGVALGVERSSARTLEELRAEFPLICETIAQTRPTAVDLFWAIERMTRRFEQLSAANSPLDALRRAMVEEARAIHAEKRATDEAMGRFGAQLMPAAGQVMTQCNAGALATAGIGSALGVIRTAIEEGHKLSVLVPETRPYLQGARLTAWELHEGGVPLTLITDNMVGHFMKTGRVARSSSARTASPPTATRPTKSARTRSPCWRTNMACRFTLPRRFLHSISRFRRGNKFPSKSAPRKK